ENHDGQLDFNEYIDELSTIIDASCLRTIATVFHFFDIHNHGYITRKEFNSREKFVAQFLDQYKINKFLYEHAFNTMNINKDGRISKVIFISWHLQDHSITEEIEPSNNE
ncbi:unnamed protein product, partial [Rotaria sp. Silwood2]